MGQIVQLSAVSEGSPRKTKRLEAGGESDVRGKDLKLEVGRADPPGSPI